MTGFGDWLSTTKLDLSEITLLKEDQNNPASKWPNNSVLKKDYIDIISKAGNIDPMDGVLAFHRLWDIYLLDINHQKLSTQKVGFWDRFNLSAPTLAVIAPGAILLIIFCIALINTDLSSVNSARGIITLLFSVTTVVVAIIVTLSNFLNTNNADDADKRFQRGKDILTVLIGVFGALLGYYFGTDKNNYQPGQPPTQQGAQASLNANKSLPKPQPQANQQNEREEPAADKPPSKDEIRPGNRPQ